MASTLEQIIPESEDLKDNPETLTDDRVDDARTRLEVAYQQNIKHSSGEMAQKKSLSAKEQLAQEWHAAEARLGEIKTGARKGALKLEYADIQKSIKTLQEEQSREPFVIKQLKKIIPGLDLRGGELRIKQNRFEELQALFQEEGNLKKKIQEYQLLSQRLSEETTATLAEEQSDIIDINVERTQRRRGAAKIKSASV